MNSVKVCDLASQLFPDTSARTASQRLRRWIRSDTALLRRLERKGYSKGRRVLTPSQAGIIRRWIG